MSPAVGDFRSSSSSSAQPSSFQNPNPKYPTDSGILHTSFNPINFNFDCSKDAAPTPTVRSSRRKHAKVKKVSSFSASVSSKHVNSTGNTINFVFNASNKVSDCNPSLGKTVSSGNGEQQSIGESLDFSKFQFTMGSTNNAKNMDPEEAQNSGIGNGFQSLNFAFSADEKVDARNVTERGAEKAGKLNGLEFVFGASMNNGVNSFTSEADSLLAKSLSGLNLGTGESGDVAPLMNDNSKTQENTTSDSKSSVNLDSVFSADHRDIKTDVNYEKEESKETVEKLVSDGKVEINGLFHIGTQNKKRSNCKGRRKVNKQMNNLKKQENNVDSVRDGNYSFVFGSKLGNAFSDTPQSKVPDELKTSNNTLNNDSCSYFNNSFVFGSDKKQNKPINQNEKTEAEVIKETAPCSTNEAGTTNNFNFSSTNGVFGTSFTGFNTPDINLTSYFTSDMLTGLGKKLEFSKSNSVRPRKLRKAKAVLRQQGRNRQQPFEEASGCSPMDFSPYGGAECVSTSTNPANVSSSSTTSFAGTNLSAKQRPRKKYITKTGQGLKFTTPKVSRAHESTSGNHTKASDHEICDRWRKRGNEAYKNGDLSEAEGCYSKGISSIQHIETAGFCIEPLLLCYSNRAAARMALGRLREGLKDCRIAASLDPTFVKANLRSANCHLLLGELEDASYSYNKCLEFENIACLDRRLAIEAADGVQKAQKVANYVKQSAELLQQKTDESATNALRIIIDALSLSCYSEKLLNMKGEALFVLGKHKDVVQLCEQTLDSAEKNFATESKLWRWNLMSKSYFHMGRLEIALDFIEKHEQLRSTADKSVDPKESLNPLAVTIRELLHCKNAGNEAFQNGKHTEAIEHYSTAISKSMESHSFAAVCFCNRAAAHQSLGEIIDAIGDCSTSIALDETYPKAFSRRSTLWEMIRDYKHAADDLQRFISILERRPGENSQKSNGSVKDLRRARRRLSSIEENSKKERSLDLYLILGIKPSDAAAEVKKAYRKAALRHHPDKAGQVIARAESGSDGQKWKVITESIQMDADKLFKMIGEAYAVLSDSTKRSKYDLEEEMWDDMNTHACSSSSRRASDFYNSPFETTNRRDSHYSTRTYGNSHHHYWGDSRKNYQNSYPRW